MLVSNSVTILFKAVCSSAFCSGINSDHLTYPLACKYYVLWFGSGLTWYFFVLSVKNVLNDVFNFFTSPVHTILE